MPSLKGFNSIDVEVPDSIASGSRIILLLLDGSSVDAYLDRESIPNLRSREEISTAIRSQDSRESAIEYVCCEHVIFDELDILKRLKADRRSYCFKALTPFVRQDNQGVIDEFSEKIIGWRLD